MKRLLAITVAALALAAYAPAQVAPTTGLPPFASIQDGGFDKINRQNLNVNFALPIVHVNGRGLPLDFSIGYNSLVWQITGAAPSQTWAPAGATDATGSSTFGWTRDFPLGNTTYHYTQYSTKCYDGTGGWYWSYRQEYSGYQYLDSLGTAHSFPVNFIYETCTGTSSGTWTAYADDNSGFYIDISSTGSRPGRRVVYPSGASITGAVTDSNGNLISSSQTKTGTCPGSTCVVTNTLTDTLGNQALIITSSNTSTTYQYLYPDAATHKTITLNYQPYSIKTNFACSGIAEYTGSANLPVSLTYPDGQTYTFKYESTPGYSGYVTGRVKEVDLPTGGYYQYTYGSSTDSMNCSNAGTTYLTRSVYDGTATSIWSYSASGTQTWVTDAAGNQSIFTFNSSGLATTAKYYSGTTTLLRQINTSYAASGTPSNVATILEDGTTQSQVSLTYDSYARLTNRGEYDYGGSVMRSTQISYASLGNNIIDRPSTVMVRNSAGTVVSYTAYNYDEGTLTTTTGTPQLAAVSGSRGNLTTVRSQVAGSTFLTKTFTYNDTGTVNTATDVNGAQTGYSYGDCGNSFLTQVALPLGSMTRHMAWNCVGGVMTSATDENGRTITTTSYDSRWRPLSITDQGASTTTTLTYSPTQVQSSMPFGSSVIENAVTLDAIGRSVLAQLRQGPGAPSYDSVATTYDLLGRPKRTSAPYSNSLGYQDTTHATQTDYDAIGRPTLVTDAGGGTVSYSYDKSYVTQTLGPAPLGENAKQKVMQYDALGRLIGVCEVTSASGSGACGQTGKNGYWTTYTYDVLGDLLTVSQNAQSGSPQPRTYTYDGVGRMTSEANPETGTTSYTYDADATCGTSNGDLVKRVDAVGNVTCYAYDQLHRVTSISYPSGSYAANTPTKTFVYDASTASGFTLSNTKGHLAEAYTGPSNNKATDLVFSYTALGEVTDAYQSTPHSGGYYHVTGSYFANGAWQSLGGLPGMPMLTYNVDGEGRMSSVSDSTPQTLGTLTSYDSFGNPNGVTLGSGDSDTFTFDPNTGRMTQYKYTVGTTPQTVTGNLGWNANGTLGQLAIADQINTANSQTCNYGYDDLVRVAGANCGSIWTQTFGYDPFGNLSKTGSVSFQPTYDTATNQVGSVGGQAYSYDANGNTLNDTLQTYAWDAEGKAVTISGINVTYDALGRMAEQNTGSGYVQVVYAPTGQKFALMNAQTVTKAFVQLPGGAQAVYVGTTLTYFRHPDWLGSARLTSTTSQGWSSDTSYGPFGEPYPAGTASDASFTGQNQDTVQGNAGGLYDFTYREYALYGRWISPDPAGLNAIRLTTPQSWNRYAYVLNNPLGLVDPLGLADVLIPMCSVDSEGTVTNCWWTDYYSPDTPAAPGDDTGDGAQTQKSICTVNYGRTTGVGPYQALGPGAFGIPAPTGSVAVDPVALGFPYDTIQNRSYFQSLVKPYLSQITFNFSPTPNLPSGLPTTYTLGDILDPQSRVGGPAWDKHPALYAFDIYRFPNDAAAKAASINVQVTVTYPSSLPFNCGGPIADPPIVGPIQIEPGGVPAGAVPAVRGGLKW